VPTVTLETWIESYVCKAGEESMGVDPALNQAFRYRNDVPDSDSVGLHDYPGGTETVTQTAGDGSTKRSHPRSDTIMSTTSSHALGRRAKTHKVK
jgi:hypothetical protein